MNKKTLGFLQLALLVPTLCLCFASCTKKVLLSELFLEGDYACLEEDGKSCAQFYRFQNGKFSHFQISGPADFCYYENGTLWGYREAEWEQKDIQKYSVIDGVVRLEKGSKEASVTTDSLYMDKRAYPRVKKLEWNTYLRLQIEQSSPIISYAASSNNVSYSIDRSVGDFPLRLSTDADWISNLKSDKDKMSFSVSENSTGAYRSGKIDLVYGIYARGELVVTQTWSASELTANSYIVSIPGEYSFPTVKGNSSISVGNVSRAVVLWESFGTVTKPSTGDIIQNVSYTSGTISFSTPETLKNGNAVIAAKDASGDILWSWHIWVCSGYDPIETAQTYYNNAGVIMDRNLGATSATPGDVKSLGLLYQWGRKDPFLGSSSVSSNTKAASTLSWPSAVSSNSSTGTIKYTVKNPTTFIKWYDHDWFYRTLSDNNYQQTRWWDSSKTIYDPCPPSWKVTDGAEDGVWAKATGNREGFKYPLESNCKGMNFSGKFGTASSIWYPAAGFIDGGNAVLMDVGDGGYWWSCSPYWQYSFLFALSGSYENVRTAAWAGKAYACSVRCMKE